MSEESRARGADHIARASRALAEAFGKGYSKAKLDLASGQSRPLTHAQSSFRIEVPLSDVLQERWHRHLLRFAQLGRTAGLGAGHHGRATLAPVPRNGSDLAPSASLYWTVEVSQ